MSIFAMRVKRTYSATGSKRLPDLHAEGHCKWGDMERIVLPEFHKPYPSNASKQFGLCEVDAIKNSAIRLRRRWGQSFGSGDEQGFNLYAIGAALNI